MTTTKNYNYKGVEISLNTITGMASANIMVYQSIISTENGIPKAVIAPKKEKLFGRLNNVKGWIDKHFNSLCLNNS